MTESFKLQTKHYQAEYHPNTRQSIYAQYPDKPSETAGESSKWLAKKSQATYLVLIWERAVRYKIWDYIGSIPENDAIQILIDFLNRRQIKGEHLYGVK